MENSLLFSRTPDAPLPVVTITPRSTKTVSAATITPAPITAVAATIAPATTDRAFPLFSGVRRLCCRCQHKPVERLVLYRRKHALHEAMILVLLEQGRVVVFLRVLFEWSSEARVVRLQQPCDLW